MHVHTITHNNVNVNSANIKQQVCQAEELLLAASIQVDSTYARINHAMNFELIQSHTMKHNKLN